MTPPPDEPRDHQGSEPGPGQPAEAAGEPGEAAPGPEGRTGGATPEPLGDAPPSHAGPPPEPEPEPRRSPLGPGIGPGARLPPPPVPRRPEPQWVDLERILDAETFQLREVESVGPLAESIARLGQREPVELRPLEDGYQLVAGHRRLAAVQLLHRSRILARVHPRLGDADALLMALADDLDRRPWSAHERSTLEARLEALGLLPPQVTALLGRAEAQAHPELAPEGEDEGGDEEELELEALAARVRDHLADVANDLAVLYEDWADLDEGRREDLVEVVRYFKDMYPFLVGPTEEDE